MTRRMIAMLVITGLLFGGIFGWKAYSGYQAAQRMQAMAMPSITVSTADVRNATWASSIPAVGSLRAMQGVYVTVQIAGLITELHFHSGDTVKKGELLVKQYAATDAARLQGLVAETRLAELNLERGHELLPKKLISQFDFDSIETALLKARAAEQALRLTIAEKSIRAPFSGRLGLRQVDVGQYIQPGETIARLEAMEQILVNFSVPQKFISQLTVGQPIAATVDAWPEQRFAGTIRAIDPQINRDTRMLKLQGTLDNPDGRLMPGMFARVKIALEQRNDVHTVPQAAIAYSPSGDSVYVVSAAPDDATALAVRSVFVVSGDRRGDQIEIISGLQAGMTVVTAGQQKLHNGARVVVDNSVPVSNQPAPAVENN